MERYKKLGITREIPSNMEGTKFKTVMDIRKALSYIIDRMDKEKSIREARVWNKPSTWKFKS